jgi:hypothetical protein
MQELSQFLIIMINLQRFLSYWRNVKMIIALFTAATCACPAEMDGGGKISPFSFRDNSPEFVTDLA